MQKEKKVIQINATYGIGSTGRIMRDIDHMLVQDGYESVCVYCQTGIEEPENGYRMGNTADEKIHALMTRIEGRQAYGSRIQTKKLLKMMDYEKPDIVHLHNLHSNYINLNLLFAYLAEYNIATVLTLHDCWFFTGKCTYFDIIDCEKWRKECNNCPQNKKEVKSLFVDNSRSVFYDKKKLYEMIKKLYVVGCSQWISGLAAESPLLKDADIRTITNGVDTELFRNLDHDMMKRKFGLSGRFVILGFANKWLYENNPEIMGKIVDTYPDSTIILIGCTKKEETLINRKFTDRQIMPVLYVHNTKELAEYYAAADVLVNLTLEDNYPTVNMESICCGTPVITYDTGGSPEMIEENVTGYVVEQGNWQELKKCIDEVKNNRLDRNACSEYGRMHFNQRDRYMEYVGLYRDI